eukprot:382907-Rhodomonas_salina.3
MSALHNEVSARPPQCNVKDTTNDTPTRISLQNWPFVDFEKLRDSSQRIGVVVHERFVAEHQRLVSRKQSPELLQLLDVTAAVQNVLVRGRRVALDVPLQVPRPRAVQNKSAQMQYRPRIHILGTVLGTFRTASGSPGSGIPRVSTGYHVGR